MKRFVRSLKGTMRYMFNEDFCKDINKFEYLLLCLGAIPFIVFTLIKTGILSSVRWIRDVFSTQNEHQRNTIKKVAIVSLIAVVIVGTIFSVRVHAEKTQETVKELKSQVTYITVEAGSEKDQYYTWWMIASEYCPDYMFVDNYRIDDERNYLQALYDANGGSHILQAGERVKVPIYPVK